MKDFFKKPILYYSSKRLLTLAQYYPKFFPQTQKACLDVDIKGSLLSTDIFFDVKGSQEQARCSIVSILYFEGPLIEAFFVYKIRIENIKHLFFKQRMISEAEKASALKFDQNGQTDVSTENSCNNSHYSLNSSFQERSPQDNFQADQEIEGDSIIECQGSLMKNESIFQSKKSLIAYYKEAMDWLSRKYKRFKIQSETLYLAISLLLKLIDQEVSVKNRGELSAGVCLLLAAKINQIHFPSIKFLMEEFDFFITKNDILQLQQEIVQLFNFELNIQKNGYSVLRQYFPLEYEQKQKNAEKLLFLAISNLETLQFGEIYLGFSIIYLLQPELMKDINLINRDKMKKVAFIVYNMYNEKKNQVSSKESSSS